MTRALRVLHVASGDLWAGAEVQMFTLITHLAQMPETDVAAVLMNGGILANKLRDAGIPVYVMDELNTGSLRILMRLRSVLKSWRPDIIHTHREKENILGSLACFSCRNVPSVRTVHGGNEQVGATGLGGVRRRVVNEVDRWCGRTLQKRVIAVTGELATCLSHEYQAEKIVVIENGVDIEAVRAHKGVAEFRKTDPECTHIGIVGRLVQVKRVDLFIETASLLWSSFPQRNWRFHVFGDGHLRTELRILSETMGVAGAIRFHGHRQDIATCITGLDALIICSDHEGMPMIALEAAALEVPTVAHAIGGLPDIVPQEFLVFSHDARGYRDGILEALREGGHDITRKYARESLPRFSARRNADRIRALYQQTLAEWNGG